MNIDEEALIMIVEGHTWSHNEKALP